MLISVSYFFTFGCLNLLIQTIRDLKNNMNVDTRPSFIMMGIAISLVSHIRRPVTYMIALIIFMITFYYFLKRLKVFGEADNITLNWIILGLGIFGAYILIFFLAFFIILTVLYWILRRLIFKENIAVPFFPVIFLTFVSHGVLLKYWA